MINRKTVFALLIGILFIMVILGSSTVKSGIGLGVAGAISMSLIYSSLPEWIKRVVIKLHFFIDIAFSILIYRFFGAKTATAVIGAVTAEVLLTFMLLNEQKLFQKPATMGSVIRRIS